MLQSVIRFRFVALTLGACVAVSAPLAATSVVPRRQATPVYDAKFTVNTPDGAQVYSGVTTFNVDKEGKVTGKMSLDTPVGVEGVLAGSLKADSWTFEYGYTIAQQACDGTVTGTAKVSKDRKVIEGTAKISGACAPTPLDATFSFTQRDKGPR